MGKMRYHRAYLSISASGPLLNNEISKLLDETSSDMRYRALAKLAYTTADIDYLEKNWATENYDTAPNELHKRLQNPSIAEFRRELKNIGKWFSQFYEDQNWEGGCLTFTFAGHGREADGALVLEDGDIEWRTFLDELLKLVPDNNEHRLRINILLDSCYSGMFLTETHYAMRNYYTDKFFPYYSAASSMIDEVAREYRSLGHGLFTYCFSIRSETPESFIATAIQPDNTFGPSLSLVRGPYGCSFLTQGTQNPVIIDGDNMELCGESIELYKEDNLIPLEELHTKMREIRANFRYLFSGFNFPNGMMYGSGRIKNSDIEEDLERKRELYEWGLKHVMKKE
ncbi:hypothetical protein [Priestia sp. YIM B13490]|uniref:hypothetical protein n=1 Tax=Priestia sp. YIM B13490 TaxID=3366310 RepID=UPI00366DDBEE